MSIRVLGAAVIVVSAVSSPALAQAVISSPAACESQFASANCLNRGAGSPYDSNARRYRRQTAYRGPVDAAAGVAGAAVGTAAAVATAPFRGWGNSYAAYGVDRPAAYGEYAWSGDWNTYATRNGIVCRPGTYFKGADGLRHICQ
ncbi:hypothetical protein ABIB82_000715 [Bradyrhizobium sp. i1.8.4]|uniref:hypothetical protein n=1 Tax=unclassified Bradyrhizobium TaxID=2631580 RepID=UPI003D207133